MFLKRILILILLFIGVGCKVVQQPAGNAEHQPESSSTMRPDKASHTHTDHDHDHDHETEDKAQPADMASDKTDSISHPDEARTALMPTDSLQTPADSALLADINERLSEASMITDTVPKKKGMLEAVVKYEAEDSVIWTAGNIAYLYGKGDVQYQNMKLESEVIRMSIDSSLLYATFGVDSLGDEYGFPKLTEGDRDMEARHMNYNFKTQHAYAINVVTREGEGFVLSDQAKKMDDNTMFMQKGKYTTCDDPEPHFYIHLTKGKVRTGKDITTGPVFLVIEDVPLPLALPFAFFPFTSTYSSGIIMPSYGDELDRGFFLRDGGYYFAVSDYFDLRLTGEIFTKGSWGLNGASSYRKRYKYNGNVNVSYLKTIRGDKDLDYSESTDFKLAWSHTQDPKANPFRTFSARVDFSLGNYDRNNLNSLYSPASSQNNKGSSVSLSQRFPNSPWSLSATMTINQRSQDSSISVTLPNMTLTMSRIYPLKRKNAIGKDRWYEKISMSYNGSLQNSINTHEDKIFKSNLIKDWKNGMQHQIPISATYSLFNYINVSPSVNYSERWLTTKVDQQYDQKQRRLVPIDTTYGFYRVYNYSASISAQTTIYGIFTPIKMFQKYVNTIRHRMEPSVSFSYNPDFGDPKYGYHRYYTTTYINGFGEYETASGHYTPYEYAPGIGKSGSINLSVANNIEAKIPDVREESGLRKISLIDNLAFSTSYNMAVDTIKWNNLNTNLRLKIMKQTLNLNAVFDVYTYDYTERTSGNVTSVNAFRVNKLRIKEGKGIGRLQSTGTSFSYTLNNETFKKLFGRGDDEKSRKKTKTNTFDDDDMMNPDDPYDTDDPFQTEEPLSRDNSGSRLSKKKETVGEYDVDGYYNSSIPWSLSMNFNLNVGYDNTKFNTQKKEYEYKITPTFSFSGNIQPTKNWRLTFSSSYDFDQKKIAQMTCNISRQMHCFQMTISLIPIGNYKSYSFTIAASASMLKDLKYDQRSAPSYRNLWP